MEGTDFGEVFGKIRNKEEWGNNCNPHRKIVIEIPSTMVSSDAKVFLVDSEKKEYQEITMEGLNLLVLKTGDFLAKSSEGEEVPVTGDQMYLTIQARNPEGQLINVDLRSLLWKETPCY